MPRRSGRPRRPPRRDRDEIKRNSARWQEEVKATLAAMAPVSPPDPTAQAWMGEALSEMGDENALRGLVGNTEDPSLLGDMGGDRRREIEKNIARWLAFRRVADRFVRDGKWTSTEADEHVDRLGFLPRAMADAVSRGEVSPRALSDEQIGRYWPLSENGVSARLAQRLENDAPLELDHEDKELTDLRRNVEALAETLLPPAWVLDAVCDALAALRPPVDEVVLATQLALGLVGGGTDHGHADPVRTVSMMIRAPGVHGAKARLTLFLNAKARFEAFVATVPTPNDYRETLLGFFVPIFNATHPSERRCLVCGQQFALRRAAEVKRSLHCSDECQRLASKRGVRSGKHHSASERRLAAAKRHMESCNRCKTGKLCAEGELKFQGAADALDRKRGKMPSE